MEACHAAPISLLMPKPKKPQNKGRAMNSPSWTKKKKKSK